MQITLYDVLLGYFDDNRSKRLMHTMKTCNHCGAQLLDEAVMCPKCGCPAIGSGTSQKPSGISIAALICAFFIPLLGWILGGIGKKNAPNNVSRDLSVAGIVIATIVFVVNLLLL